MFLPFKVAKRMAQLAIGLLAAYLLITFGQVVLASRRDDARSVDAIVVMGAAQYDGRPSPVLKARLDHAVSLYQAGRAPVVVVTGGRQQGDRFTEADAGANYLKGQGVPDAAVLKDPVGGNSWESLRAASGIVKQRGGRSVLLVSDPFHEARIAAMAAELGLEAHTSPTRTSPITGWNQLPYLGKETIAVAIGRVVGFGAR